MTNPRVSTDLAGTVDLLTGFPFKSSSYCRPEEGVPLLRGDNVVQRGIRWDGAKHWPTSLIGEFVKYRLRPGDVVLAMDRPWIEAGLKVAEIRGGDAPSLLVQRVARLRTRSPGLRQDFLKWLLYTPAFTQHVLSVQTGTAVPHISGGQILSFKFELPELDEQRRIAGVLGAFDDLIDNLHETQAQLDELARYAFVIRWDGTTRIRLSDIGHLTMGQSPPGSTYNETGDGMPFYQGVRDFGDRYPTVRVHCSAPTRVAQAGDILIAVRAPIGSTNVATSTTAIGRGLAALRATRPSTALHAVRADPSLWSPYEGEGTVFSSINGPTLRNVAVPWVEDPELENHLRALDDLHRACAEDIERLARARDELLPLLMSGRITVDEAWEAAAS